jgi:regulator of sigma E protease
MTIIIFLIVLGILVFVHELGHFLAAKYFGVRVDEFAIGFPPRALTLGKRDGTTYVLNWIPFGGYVKIYGEDGEGLGTHDPDYTRSFTAQSWYKKIIILLGGVVFNMVFAFLLLCIVFLARPTVSEYSAHYPERLVDIRQQITGVLRDGPAGEAGIEPGEAITSFTFSSVPETTFTFSDTVSFSELVNAFPEDDVIVTLLDDEDAVRTVTVTPEVIPREDGSSERRIGVMIEPLGTYRPTLLQSLHEGLRTTGFITTATVEGLGNLIRDAVRGEGATLESVTGPVGLVSVVGDARDAGLIALLTLTAIISINLAIINAVPFPALDGGRIIIVLLELLPFKKNPFTPRVTGIINIIGFALLILLMIVITIRDVGNLF